MSSPSQSPNIVPRDLCGRRATTRRGPMIEVVWLGVLLNTRAALSVGPIFVSILIAAATRGFVPAFRVILGSATADALLLLPALACAWVIAAVARAEMWVGLAGAGFFAGLAVLVVRVAWWLRRAGEV